MEFARERVEPSLQLELKELLPPRVANIDVVLADLREFVSNLFKSNDLPQEAARYLVVYDPATFHAAPLTDIRFSFEGKFVPLPTATPESIGFDVSALLSSFVMTRLFVPRIFVEEVRDHIDKSYGIRDSSSDQSGDDQ